MSNSLIPAENQQQHRKYLEDLAIRLICVFALDRFGDFVSDQVVAPVRETCAQTLGVTLKYMSKEEVRKVLSCLLLLQNHTLWEIRHGGLLGLRFILAVRTDLAAELLPFALPSITSGLLDRDDDVRAVAADSLLPVSTLLPEVCGSEVPQLLRVLWDSLLELDDLTASTSSVMQLLCNFNIFFLFTNFSSFLSLDLNKTFLLNSSTLCPAIGSKHLGPPVKPTPRILAPAFVALFPA